MASDSSSELRTAVVARLQAVTAVTDLVPATKILSVVRQDKVTKPYIHVEGVVTDEGFDTKTTDGFQGIFEVSCYSKTLANDTGMASVESIRKQVVAALNASTVSVASPQTLTVFHYTSGAKFEEPDGETYHAVARFRFMTCEE
jgi:hypothetical protein